MIQPLRTRHRWTFGALTIVLPVLFFAGLKARTPLPVQAGEPPVIAARKLRTHELRGPDHHIVIRIADDRTIEVAPGSYTLSPDVLIYWSAAPQATSLPQDARCLGPLRVAATYGLPAPGGTLIFYSAPNGKAIASLALGGPS